MTGPLVPVDRVRIEVQTGSDIRVIELGTPDQKVGLRIRLTDGDAQEDVAEWGMRPNRGTLVPIHVKLEALGSEATITDPAKIESPALTELRRLAAEARLEARRFVGTSSPLGFGPHRAAEAYEKAVELLENERMGA